MNRIVNSRWSITCLMLPGILLASCNYDTQKAKPVRYVVEIKEMRFQPAELTVHAGDTVEWVNQDFVEHDVTEENEKAWSSSRLATGKSWRMVIRKSADYYCSIHQVMKGKLTVQ